MNADQRSQLDWACDGGRLLPVAEYLRLALIVGRALLEEMGALRVALAPVAPPKPAPAPVAPAAPAKSTKRRRASKRG